jgi:tRNA (cytidine/uridine-2'-O-)-methyltransferase
MRHKLLCAYFFVDTRYCVSGGRRYAPDSALSNHRQSGQNSILATDFNDYQELGWHAPEHSPGPPQKPGGAEKRTSTAIRFVANAPAETLSMLNVVLYQPEIPPNTGNVIRLCANTRCAPAPGGSARLLAGRRAREARRPRLSRDGGGPPISGLEVLPGTTSGCRIPWAFSTRGRRNYCDVAYGEEVTLLFGPETRGLPAELLDGAGPDRVLRLPMASGSRSLNLSNAVAVAVYEVLRQTRIFRPRAEPGPFSGAQARSCFCSRDSRSLRHWLGFQPSWMIR